MAGGTLSETIQSEGFKDVPVMRKLQLALQIASGLDYLHTRDEPVVHSDIKRYGWTLHLSCLAPVAEFKPTCRPRGQNQCVTVMLIHA